MRTQRWTTTLAAALGCLVPDVRAQTGSLKDLGSLLASQKNLTTFYSLIQKYPQILFQLPSQDGVTILAPNNDAFEKIPYTELNAAFANNDQTIITNVLEYHILSGSKTAAQLIPGAPVFIPTLLTNPSFSNVSGGATVENVKQAGDVVVFDLEFNGGYVQVIDSLLIPPANLTTTIESFNLTSFEGALYQTNKLTNYTTTPNSTIFVPQNDAFQALGPAIANMTTDQLSAILDYHLIPSQVLYTPNLTNGSTFVTANGGKITVRQGGNNLYINSAQLLNANILIANGVLHTIDNVLNPAGPDALPNPQIASQGPVFASAERASNLPFTSAIPCTSSCPVSSVTSASASVTGEGVAATRTSVRSSATAVSSSSSRAGVARARETGLGGVGLVMAVGGAVLMI
ncbi:FAS1 [Glarea lozoyensis ATCC 20868]|uniref:FAS1 n=1 Tax=Glarea lozoyensis (strain ATCC 20868 / MF5171) TaxID=1116229 RepID=S3CJL8_GLAL2|nr:FAS1 [Glarea lozoyensis ATCC 20868]EPE26712.1 FAS1 [Glarea lozoyensis ATCC 20868]